MFPVLQVSEGLFLSHNVVIPEGQIIAGFQDAKIPVQVNYLSLQTLDLHVQNTNPDNSLWNTGHVSVEIIQRTENRTLFDSTQSQECISDLLSSSSSGTFLSRVVSSITMQYFTYLKNID